MNKHEEIMRILNSQADEGPGCEGGRDFRFPAGLYDQATIDKAFDAFLAGDKAKAARITISYVGRQGDDERYFVQWSVGSNFMLQRAIEQHAKGEKTTKDLCRFLVYHCDPADGLPPNWPVSGELKAFLLTDDWKIQYCLDGDVDAYQQECRWRMKDWREIIQ